MGAQAAAAAAAKAGDVARSVQDAQGVEANKWDDRLRGIVRSGINPCSTNQRPIPRRTAASLSQLACIEDLPSGPQCSDCSAWDHRPCPGDWKFGWGNQADKAQAAANQADVVALQ